MMRKWLASSLLFSLLMASPSNASVLWQNAESGMSHAQIAYLFPKAIKPVSVAKIRSGATCDLVLSDYEVGGSTFTTCFFFLDGKLTQVTLTADKPTEPLFERIGGLLRAKYGDEIGANEPPCRSGLLRICEMNWLLPGGTKVAVLLLRVGNKEPLLNINYQTRMAEDAAKL